MVKNRERVEPIKKDIPLYAISIAANLLNIHPRTLRIYEDEGLITPQRRGSRRLYSENDLQWIRCLRTLIHDEGISIPGIKRLLRYAPCYEIANCPDEIHCSCAAVVDKAIPRTLHLAGDADAEHRAKAKDIEERQDKAKKKLGEKVQKKTSSR